MNLPQLPDLADALIMLDLDGTLIEFAPTPDAVVVPEDLTSKLGALDARSQGLSLISGRSVADVSQLLPGFAGDIYGSHGSEFRVAGITGNFVDVDESDVHAIWQAADDIARAAPAAIFTERKPAGVVLHYRAAPDWQAEAVGAMTAIADRYPAFEMHGSKMAAELRPRGYTKGDAAKAAIEGAAEDSVPVFAGDDTTDEDAMRVVNTHSGVSIKVGTDPTCARARVPDVAAMHALLADWLEGTK